MIFPRRDGLQVRSRAGDLRAGACTLHSVSSETMHLRRLSWQAIARTGSNLSCRRSYTPLHAWKDAYSSAKAHIGVAFNSDSDSDLSEEELKFLASRRTGAPDWSPAVFPGCFPATSPQCNHHLCCCAGSATTAKIARTSLTMVSPPSC